MFLPSVAEVRRKGHLKRLGTVQPVIALPIRRWPGIKRGTGMWTAGISLEVQPKAALVKTQC